MRILTVKSTPRNFTALEEAIIRTRIEDKTPDTVWFIRQPRMLWLANNADKKYLNFDYAKRLKLETGRSAIFTGKPTSIVILGTTIGAMFVMDKKTIPTSVDLVNYLMGFWIRIGKSVGLTLENKSNDLVVAGTDRKLLGSVAFETNNHIGCNCMFTTKLPEDIDFDNLFLMPKDKFENKEVKTPKGRITSLFNETQVDFDYSKALEILKDYVGNDKIETDITQDENDIYNTVLTTHQSNKWIEEAEGHTLFDFKLATQSFCGFH